MNNKVIKFIFFLLLIFFGQSSNAQTNSDVYFKQAEIATKNKEPQKSIDLYKKAQAAAQQEKDDRKYLLALIEELKLIGKRGDFQETVDKSKKAINTYGSVYPDSIFTGKLYSINAKSNRNLGKLDLAVDQLRKAMDIFINNGGEKEYCSAHIYEGILKWDKNEKGIEEHFDESLRLHKKHFDKDSPEIGHAHHIQGVYQMNFGDLPKAIKHFNLAKSALEKGDDEFAIANAIFYLGISFMNKGEYDNALEHMETSKQMFDSNMGEGNLKSTFVDNLIGNVYTFKGEYKIAEDYFRLAFNTRKKLLGLDHEFTIAMLMNMANQQLNQENYSIALKSLKEAAHLFEKTKVKTYDMFKVYYNIGKCQLSLLDTLQAKIAFQQAQENGYKVMPNDAIQWIDLRLKQIEISPNTGEALSYCDSAYTVILGKDHDILKLSSKEFSNLSDPIYLFKILSAQLSILKNEYKVNPQADQLNRAFELCNKGLELADFIRISSDSDQGLTEFYKQADYFFEEGLDIAWQIKESDLENQHIDQWAFGLMEKSKAWVTSKAIASNTIQEDYEILDSTKNIIQSLDLEIASLYHELNNLAISKEEEIKNIRTRIYTVKKTRENQLENIIKDHPNYASKQNAIDNIQVADVNVLLEDELDLFIEYTSANEYLYIFSSSSRSNKFHRVEKQSNYKESIGDFFADLKNNTSDINSLSEKSKQIYNLVFAPINDEVKKANNIIIVPDGLLHYIPFESLVDPSNNEFVIESKNISYAYSASILSNLSNQKQKKHNGFLALAPSFKGNKMLAMRGETNLSPKEVRQDLPALHGAAKEVKAIGAYFTGTILLDKDAIEENFINNAKDKEILHFATHAIIDDENPMNSYLVLEEGLYTRDKQEDGFLYTWELQNMDLSPAITVLSACNTAYGKLDKGEGLLSLGRSFMPVSYTHLTLPTILLV